MTIEFARFLYGIRFAEPSYTLMVAFNGSNDQVAFPATGTLDPNTDYFFSEDDMSNDLCRLLADSIASHDNGEIATCVVTIDPTTHLLVVTVTGVGGAEGLQLLWSHASTSLDATVFGFEDGVDSDLEDLTFDSPNVPRGLVYLGRPVTDDSRPRQGVLGGLVRTMDGDVEGVSLDDPYPDRSLSVTKLHRSIALEEYATATAPYATVESMHLDALARGHRVRYFPDDTDPDDYVALKHVPPLQDRLERDDSTQSRMLWKWACDFVQLPVVQPSSGPFDLYSYEFDGTGDYISLGDRAELDGATAATFSFWAYQPGVGTGQFIWAKRTGLAQMQFWIATAAGNELDFCINPTTSSNAFGRTTGDAFLAGSWYHVVCVYNGAASGNSNRMQVYIDGVLQSLSFTSTVPASMTSGTTSDMQIGAQNGSAGFSGNLDELACWVGQAADQTDVDDLYNLGVPADVSLTGLGDPDFWYRADGDVLPTATDWGTVGANGTANGDVAIAAFAP